MPGLQEDLIVEGLPLRVVGHRHRELPHAGHQVLGDALLVPLLAAEPVLQLDANTETTSELHLKNIFLNLTSLSALKELVPEGLFRINTKPCGGQSSHTHKVAVM